MLSRTFQLLASIAAFSLFSISSAGCAAQELQDRILWLDEQKTQALFLPESALEGRTLAELPLHPHHLEAIEHKIKVWNGPIRNPNKCLSQGKYSPGGSAEGARTLEQSILLSEVAVRGWVTELVLGWNVQEGAIAQMAYVHIEEVLSDRRGLVKDLDYLAVTIPGGALKIGGWQLCYIERERYQGLDVGTEVLVIGDFWPENPPYVAGAILLPVVDGNIQPRSYAQLVYEEAILWSTLRSNVQALRAALSEDP